VTEAHSKSFNYWSPRFFMSQLAFATERFGEGKEDSVGGRSLVRVLFDRRHPDVHGVQIGLSVFFHRKKVSR
jgi:hypothetical protein